MSYRGHSKGSYGNQYRSHNSFGGHKQKSHTISARLDLLRKEQAKPSIMDIPDKQANNLVISPFVYYSDKDLHRDYPLDSFAVWYDHQRTKPIYQVVKVTGVSPIGRAGTVTPYGRIVSSHQAFNSEDNEKFKERAIAEATERNKEFFKDVANKKARIEGIEERKEKLLAEKNRGQTSLFGGN